MSVEKSKISPIIEDYISKYTEKHDTFKKIAVYIENRCRTELQNGAIMCNITSRAKDPKRYSDKLYKMQVEMKKDFEKGEIEQKIKDIIGVRITLYFPCQIAEVLSRLQSLVPKAVIEKDGKDIVEIKDLKPSEVKQANKDGKDIVETKDQKTSEIKKPNKDLADPKAYPNIKVIKDTERDDISILTRMEKDKLLRCILEKKTEMPEEKTYTSNQYGDYRALHIPWEMDANSLGTIFEKELGDLCVKVEIQIQSLLMHAWSEVNHDLAYKSLNGTLSAREQHLLDLLNGVSKVGEVILLHLKGSLEARLFSEKQEKEAREFESVLELSGLMRKCMDENTQPPLTILGSVEDFLVFLKSAKKNNTFFVKTEMSTWQATKKVDISLVASLLDQILVRNDFKEQELSSKQPYLLAGLNQRFNEGQPSEQTKLTIFAQILDLACRECPGQGFTTKDNGQKIMTAYSGVRDKLYVRSDPEPFEKAYEVKQGALQDKATQTTLSNLATSLTAEASKSPFVRYSLRLARIRVWKQVENSSLGKGI